MGWCAYADNSEIHKKAAWPRRSYTDQSAASMVSKTTINYGTL